MRGRASRGSRKPALADKGTPSGRRRPRKSPSRHRPGPSHDKPHPDTRVSASSACGNHADITGAAKGNVAMRHLTPFKRYVHLRSLRGKCCNATPDTRHLEYRVVYYRTNLTLPDLLFAGTSVKPTPSN